MFAHVYNSVKSKLFLADLLTHICMFSFTFHINSDGRYYTKNEITNKNNLRPTYTMTTYNCISKKHIIKVFRS